MLEDKVEAKLYRGMPTVELATDHIAEIEESSSNPISKQPISISLESLDVELQHNQSYGIVSVSTGCICNPGGPSC